MKKKNITGVLILLIFLIFTLSILSVLLSGADIVQKLTRRDQRTYQHRTAVQYVTMRVRQADYVDGVAADNSAAPNTLILTTMIDEEPYHTLVYCYNGYLRELFCKAGTSIPLEFGEEILPMEGFQVTCENGVVRAELTFTDGSIEELIIMLRSHEGSSS